LQKLLQAILIGLRKWQTPDAMLDHIKAKLEPRVAARKEVLMTNMIQGVHDFSAWLDPLGVDLPLVGCEAASFVAQHGLNFVWR